MSGRAVEAAGDVNILLLDKTGTITFGTRQAADSCPCRGDERHLADVAKLSCLADETPEGRSIVAFAVKERFEIRGRDLAALLATVRSVYGRSRG